MVTVWLGRFFRHCIDAADTRDTTIGYDVSYSDYMTDDELSDCLNHRGHTVNWSEVERRRAAGEVQAPWEPGRTAGAVS